MMREKAGRDNRSIPGSEQVEFWGFESWIGLYHTRSGGNRQGSAVSKGEKDHPAGVKRAQGKSFKEDLKEDIRGQQIPKTCWTMPKFRDNLRTLWLSVQAPRWQQFSNLRRNLELRCSGPALSSNTAFLQHPGEIRHPPGLHLSPHKAKVTSNTSRQMREKLEFGSQLCVLIWALGQGCAPGNAQC